MLFKKIILNNIGPYEGMNSFSFETNQEKKVTLIGGKNGAGKTTFLTGVRLALYGPLAYGIKTESNKYMKKIRALLNNQAVKQANSNFKIQLDFSIVENFNRVDISIIRSWVLSEKTIKETVTVIKGNKHLSEVEKDHFFEDLRTSFPPSLLELCFFDGEEIAHLTNDDNLSNYLHELSTKIFNLDLFQNLEQDLNSYISQSSRTKEEQQLEEEKKLLLKQLNDEISSLKTVSEKLEFKRDELVTLKNRYASIKSDFNLHGGLVVEQRDQMQEQINSYEGKRKHINEQIKEFIAKDLPFFMTLPTLVELVKQLKLEEDFHVSKSLKEKINNLPIDTIIESMGVNTDSRKEEVLKSKLISAIAPEQDISLIHNASKTEAQQVFTLLSTTNVEKLSQFSDLIKTNKNLLIDIQKLKQQLKDNDSSPEFNEMILRMEEYNKTINDLESDINTLKLEQEKYQDNVEALNNKYERINQELYNLQKTKSSFEESQKIIQISKKFQEKQLRNKVKDVEYFASKMFKELLRKKEFVNHIKINQEDFKLRILDVNNEELDKEILSAGEKELLVLSVIWGTITASKKELPFILDTLLGRLDIEHKHSIISKLVPKFGIQTIILSTDSEIDQTLYGQLASFITNEYTLNYDSKNKRTIIEPHFFSMTGKKVTS